MMLLLFLFGAALAAGLFFILADINTFPEIDCYIW